MRRGEVRGSDVLRLRIESIVAREERRLLIWGGVFQKVSGMCTGRGSTEAMVLGDGLMTEGRGFRRGLARLSLEGFARKNLPDVYHDLARPPCWLTEKRRSSERLWMTMGLSGKILFSGCWAADGIPFSCFSFAALRF